MTQGSSYPLAGIKIGQTPAHRLSTPTPKLASGVSKTDMARTDAPKKSSPGSGSAAEPESAATASVAAESVTTGSVTTESAKTTGATPDTSTDGASKSTTKQEPSTTPKQPSQDSNEVEVTTSDQISEHGLPTNGRSTHSSSSTPATGTGTGRSGAPDRRTAMGVASVRIAGRLTQNELGSRTGDIRTPDTSVGPDELLQLLGEYLVSGGLQNPEVHVRSNGQTIVLDLLNPAKGYR